MKLHRPPFAIVAIVVSAIALAFVRPAHAGLQEATEQLEDADLGALMDIKVTSAARRTERLAATSAAVTVITAEDIARLPVTRLQDIFRYVPGMSVGRVSGNRWAISTRGGLNMFAGSLLVMVDNRIVYSPIFSGVWWDAQEIPLDEIARIEIIRGPGGTLWGVNAVNGVINIITKSAATTVGNYANVGIGTQEQGDLYLRKGIDLGNEAYLRLFASRASHDDSPLRTGGSGRDQGVVERAGFRYDMAMADEKTFQATFETYRGESNGGIVAAPTAVPTLNQFANADMEPRGGHLTGRYTQPLAMGRLQVQASFTNEARRLASLGLDYNVNAYEVEAQHQIEVDRHRFIWGLGGRRSSVAFDGGFSAHFTQPRSQLNTYNVFVQDEIGLFGDRVTLTLGSKLEHDNFTGSHVLPTIRALYAPDAYHTWWTALSRAQQTPTIGGAYAVLRDPWFTCQAPLPAMPCIAETRGGGNVTAAQVDTLEAGYRAQLTSDVSADVAAYVTRGKHISSLEFGTPELGAGYMILPLNMGDLNENRTRGLETSLDWQVRSGFRLRAGMSWYAEQWVDRLSLLSSFQRTIQLDGATPGNTQFLRGSHDIDDQFSVDWTLRHVGRIAAYGLDDYAALDLRANWIVNRWAQLSATAADLGNGRREEMFSNFFSPATVVEPSFSVNLKLNF